MILFKSKLLLFLLVEKSNLLLAIEKCFIKKIASNNFLKVLFKAVIWNKIIAISYKQKFEIIQKKTARINIQQRLSPQEGALLGNGKRIKIALRVGRRSNLTCFTTKSSCPFLWMVEVFQNLEPILD